MEKSLDVIDPALAGQRARIPGAAEAGEHTVLTVPAFTLRCACVQGKLALAPQGDSFTMFTALDALTLVWGNGRLRMQAGSSALIPAAAPQVWVEGHGRALLSTAGK